MSVRPATMAVLLFAILALPVAGCGSDDETTAQSAPAATETATATEAATQTAEPEQESGEDPDAGKDGDSDAEREREQEEAGGAADKDCSEVGDITGDPKRKLPSGIGVLSYAHLYKSEGPFGKTERFYAALDGTPEDLAARRDDAQNELVQNWGFASLSTGQEAGIEAEAHLKGAKHTVDLQIAPLCKGKIRIRYTVQ